MDFIDGLPVSGHKNVVFVVVDRLTKYAHFLSLKHLYTAQDVADLFLREVYKLHGLPQSIVSDRDPVFTSQFWQTLFKSMGTQLKLSTSYYPQTDGQTERLNLCLESYLRAMTSNNPKQWTTWLPLAEWWYNTNHHTALNTTPFQALYGFPPPHIPLGPLPYPTQSQAGLYLTHRQQLLHSLKDNLVQAQSRMKFYADRNRSERVLQEGDLVYLKLQPYRQTSLAIRRNLKLSARYYGPYKILQRIGAVAYRLELPAGSTTHPVFHVSQLKRRIGPYVVPHSQAPIYDDDGLVIVQPLAILQHRMVKENNTAAVKVLVHWTNFSPEEATWEDWNYIRRQFPAFAAQS